MRLVREHGYADQFEFHSPTSQYGQLTRREAYDDDRGRGDACASCVDDIASGRFADEWDAERDAGYPELVRARASSHAGAAVRGVRGALRAQLGQGATAARDRSSAGATRYELANDNGC